MKQTIREVRVENITIGANPRKFKKDPAYNELLESIGLRHVRVPIHVKEIEGNGKKYELIAGQRRLRACIELKRPLIPAIIESGNEAELFETTLVENRFRAALSPAEEFNATKWLVGLYGEDVKRIAKKMGISDQHARALLRLSDLIPEWKASLDKETNDSLHFSAEHLALIARCDHETQRDLLARFRWRQDISIERLKAMIDKDYRHALSAAPFDTSICEECVTRSDAVGQQGLWSDIKVKAKTVPTCLRPSCWNTNVNAAVGKKYKELLRRNPKAKPITGPELITDIENQELVKKYPGLVDRYALKVSKKATPGSFPVIQVTGKSAGTIRYMERIASGSGREGGKQLDPETGRAKPLTLAERRSQLNLKRWILILEKLGMDVNEREKPPAGADVPALVCAFGTSSHSQYLGDGAWDRYDKGCRQDTETKRIIMWEAVKGVLQTRLAYTGSIKDLPKAKVEDAKRYMKLCGLNPAIYETEAASEIPEPKSWKGLKKDETKK